MSSRIVAIVQARMGSSRLPGKVLEPVAGKPMLLRELERARRASRIDDLIVATTENDEDDALSEAVEQSGSSVHRGSEDDVIDRFRSAAKHAGADAIVRLTGDCPLVDPEIIDETIESWLAGQPAVDFASNALSGTYPDGMDVEVFSRQALERAWAEAHLPSEREHVTFYFWKSGKFQVRSLTRDPPAGHVRLTVDYPEDLELVRSVYDALLPRDPEFGLDAILEFVGGLHELPNAGIDRTSGWEPALRRDRIGGAASRAPERPEPGDESA